MNTQFKIELSLTEEDKQTVFKHLENSMNLHRTGNYAESIQELENVLRLNPQSSTAYNNLGTNYFRLRMHVKAIQAFNKAIEINPEYLDAFYNLGLIHHALENYPQAIAHFKKALELAKTTKHFSRMNDPQQRITQAVTNAESAEAKKAAEEENEWVEAVSEQRPEDTLFKGTLFDSESVSRGSSYIAASGNSPRF